MKNKPSSWERGCLDKLLSIKTIPTGKYIRENVFQKMSPEYDA